MLYVVDSIDTWCLDSGVFLLYTLNDVSSEINKLLYIQYIRKTVTLLEILLNC